jgi:predicted dehydrogenase
VQSNVFLIGLGSIAVKYDLTDLSTLGKTHARAVDSHKDFILAGGYDPSEKNRLDFSRHYNKMAFENLEYGLKKINPEVVVIASPTEKHLQSLENILLWSNPRLILCEKPISLLLEDAKRMVQLCAERNIPLFVNYFRNSEPSTFQIANAINTRKLTQPFTGSCTYNKGAMHTATHFLNLFQIWFGDPIEFKFICEKFNSHNPLDPNIEFEVRYQGGLMKFHVDISSNSLTFHTSIDFSNGLLEYRKEGEEIDWIESTDIGNFRNQPSNPIEKFESLAKQAQFNVWNEISNYIHLKNYRLCSARDAIRYIIQISDLRRK